MFPTIITALYSMYFAPFFISHSFFHGHDSHLPVSYHSLLMTHTYLHVNPVNKPNEKYMYIYTQLARAVCMQCE